MNVLLSAFVAIDLVTLAAMVAYVASHIFGVGFHHHRQRFQ
jgi:hypothetical protein